MLPGHYRIPFGEFEGYSLNRLTVYHQDYVKEFLADTQLCMKYPSIAMYFGAATGEAPATDTIPVDSEFIKSLEDAEPGDHPEPEPKPEKPSRWPKRGGKGRGC